MQDAAQKTFEKSPVLFSAFCNDRLELKGSSQTPQGVHIKVHLKFSYFHYVEGKLKWSQESPLVKYEFKQ